MYFQVFLLNILLHLLFYKVYLYLNLDINHIHFYLELYINFHYNLIFEYYQVLKYNNPLNFYLYNNLNLYYLKLKFVGKDILNNNHYFHLFLKSIL